MCSLVAISTFLLPRITNSLSFLNLTIAPSAYYVVYGILLVLGILIGVVGSGLAMRRYLKV